MRRGVQHALLVLLVIAAQGRSVPHAMAEPPDPYRWLEDVDGKRALDWVRAHNRTSQRALTRSPAFGALQARLRSILDSEDKIPGVEKLGAYYYNFWRDHEHVRGIWRRTTLEEYRKAQPWWQTVLDRDALSEQEHVPWVWHGAEALPPDYARCLVSLSRGGAHAEVVRVLDLQSLRF